MDENQGDFLKGKIKHSQQGRGTHPPKQEHKTKSKRQVTCWIIKNDDLFLTSEYCHRRHKRGGTYKMIRWKTTSISWLLSPNEIQKHHLQASIHVNRIEILNTKKSLSQFWPPLWKLTFLRKLYLLHSQAIMHYPFFQTWPFYASNV